MPVKNPAWTGDLVKTWDWLGMRKDQIEMCHCISHQRTQARCGISKYSCCLWPGERGGGSSGEGRRDITWSSQYSPCSPEFHPMTRISLLIGHTATQFSTSPASGMSKSKRWTRNLSTQARIHTSKNEPACTSRFTQQVPPFPAFCTRIKQGIDCYVQKLWASLPILNLGQRLPILFNDLHEKLVVCFHIICRNSLYVQVDVKKILSGLDPGPETTLPCSKDQNIPWSFSCMLLTNTACFSCHGSNLLPVLSTHSVLSRCGGGHVKLTCFNGITAVRIEFSGDELW